MIFRHLFKKKRPSLEQQLAEIKAANILRALSWSPKDLAMLYEWSRPIRLTYAHILAQVGTTPVELSWLPFPKENIKIALQLQALVHLTRHQSPFTPDEDETLHAITTAYEYLCLFQKLSGLPHSPALAEAVSECMEKEYNTLLQLPDNPDTWSEHQKFCICRLAADIAGIAPYDALSSVMDAERMALSQEIWELIDTLLLAKQEKWSA